MLEAPGRLSGAGLRHLSRRSKLAAVLAAVLVVVLASGVALKVIAGNRAPHPAGARGLTAHANATGLQPSSSQPSPSSLPLASAPFVPARLMIRRLSVDAPIEVKGIDAHNQMEAPDHPFDAAWYRFTTMPGAGGNAVFSGHLDAETVGPAIFWRLSQLTPGDVIEVVSSKPSELRYQVTQTSSYPISTIPMKSVLYPGGGDQITLITCAGHYQPPAGYDHRLVIRASKAIA